MDQNAVFYSANAIRQALADFSNENPGIMTEQHGQPVVDPDFLKEIESRSADILNLAQSGDALTAHNMSRHIYAEAFSKVQRDRARAASAQAAERRTADQAASLKKKKRAQASAGVSSKRASPPSKKINGPADMTTAQLKAAIDRM